MREVGDLTLIFKGTWEFLMETCESTSEEDERRLKGAKRLGRKHGMVLENSRLKDIFRYFIIFGVNYSLILQLLKVFQLSP